MKAHRVIISLGSNIGNRQEYIEKAIEYIHFQIGSVYKISSIYETPAWGFDSNPFYNCIALIQTYFPAEKVLEILLEIEIQLGRKRRDISKGYSARTIDLDIVAFDDEIIKTQVLKIPHPLMQERTFVLYPLKEVLPDWEHPVLKKKVSQLIKSCEEDPKIKKIVSLPLPFDKFKNITYSRIVVEGIIGAGKTTLVQKIADDFSLNAQYESFNKNPFLVPFYEHPERHALALELSFLTDRHRQLVETEKDLQKNEGLISDYHIYKSFLFSSVTLNTEEFELYRNIFQLIINKTREPDLYVFLDIKAKQAIMNIEKRGRDYEKTISENYLHKLRKKYHQYLMNIPDDKKIIIRGDDLDFVQNPAKYHNIIENISRKLKKQESGNYM